MHRKLNRHGSHTAGCGTNNQHILGFQIDCTERPARGLPGDAQGCGNLKVQVLRFRNNILGRSHQLLSQGAFRHAGAGSAAQGSQYRIAHSNIVHTGAESIYHTRKVTPHTLRKTCGTAAKPPGRMTQTINRLCNTKRLIPLKSFQIHGVQADRFDTHTDFAFARRRLICLNHF